MRPARQRMPRDDRHELVADEIDDLPQQLGVLELVAVEPLHQLLPAVDHELLGERQRAQPLERPRVELERALVLQLLEDVRLHLGDRTFGVDEVIVIELTQ